MSTSKLGQYIKQEQSLSLSPVQLITSKLVELTSLELSDYIEHELEENPALEEGLDENPNAEFSIEEEQNQEEQDWELGEYASEDDIPSYKLNELQERQNFREEIPFSAYQPSLDSLLLEQLLYDGLSAEDEETARYLIGNISLDGYLSRSPEELQDDLLFKFGLDIPLTKITSLITKIKTLDPPGIGAKDLQESLLIQIDRLETQDPWKQSATTLLSQYYEEFKSKNFKVICTKMQISTEELAIIYEHISHLNPKPGRGLTEGTDDKLLHYRPDFIIEEDENGELTLLLVGEQDIKPLRLSPLYKEILNNSLTDKTQKQKDTQNFLRHKIDKAKWFIEALTMRQNTLKKTMLAIMKWQEKFLLSGDISDLKPMILKDISELTNLDISTISRVSNRKSVQTSHGIYPIKFFFGDGLVSEQGEETSTKAIKFALENIIKEEDKSQPLTDDEITLKLAELGFKLARRTIAKYRESLNIPIARLRRSL